jgi:chromosome segregation ATPase
VEVLKELQALIDEREVRDRLDRGPLAEAKGREHWVLHLLLRAAEVGQLQTNTLIGTAYSNLTSRLQSIEDRLQRIEGSGAGIAEELKTRLQGLESTLGERVSKDIQVGFSEATERLNSAISGNLDTKWKPVSESIETFARSSHQLTKDLSDTYRIATQTRLLLNENARRITDLGRDLVALEESLKLSLTKALEEVLAPLEERIAALENRLTNGELPSPGTHAPVEPPAPG